jgi:hypothetical protein
MDGCHPVGTESPMIPTRRQPTRTAGVGMPFTRASGTFDPI